MLKLFQSATRLAFKDDHGQDLVEYALLLAFVALTAIGLLAGVRSDTKGLWSTINSVLTSASSTAS